ncbi:MAG: hypothetical protein JXK05_06970 [Campylobacterales bacterium]|nr:hypothetical protein [Campylobacterales bacterium]
MLRHIIAGLGGALSLAAFLYMYANDTKFDKLGKIQAVLDKSEMMATMAQTEAQVGDVPQQVIGSAVTQMADKTDESAETLKALKEKAGSMASFKVSPEYKVRCSSCHGNNGEGGVGPKIIGLSEAHLIQSLTDFKTGKKQNYVMYGLLANMSQEELDALAKEIATFEAKSKIAQ